RAVRASRREPVRGIGTPSRRGDRLRLARPTARRNAARADAGRMRRRHGHPGAEMADVDDEGARGLVARAHDPSGAPAVSLAGEIDISNAVALGAMLDKLVGDET